MCAVDAAGYGVAQQAGVVFCVLRVGQKLSARIFGGPFPKVSGLSAGVQPVLIWSSWHLFMRGFSAKRRRRLEPPAAGGRPVDSQAPFGSIFWCCNASVATDCWTLLLDWQYTSSITRCLAWSCTACSFCGHSAGCRPLVGFPGAPPGVAKGVGGSGWYLRRGLAERRSPLQPTDECSAPAAGFAARAVCLATRASVRGDQGDS
mmetsp:Transcript_37826/g.99043  ORF Transcript_37826/g.99043 Transcript_37826/m.99043 type:complete len:204 (+) Transcript_37826:735-1346(+)